MGSVRPFHFYQLGILLAAFVLLAIFGVAVQSVRTARRASESVLRTQEVRLRFSEASADLKEAVAGIRAYLSNGDDKLLQGREQSLARYREGMAALRELVADEPVRRQNIGRIAQLVDDSLREYDAFIELRRAGDLAAMRARADNGDARRLQEELKAEIAKLQAAEAHGVDGPLEGVRADTRFTLAVLWGGLGLTAVLVVSVIVALRRDYRAREEAAVALQQQSAQIKDLYNQAPCGYHSLDADGRFVAINDTELAWLGYTREELLGRLGLRDLVAPAGLARFEEAFARLKDTGEVRDLDVELRRKDGTSFPAGINSSAIRDAAGRFVASRSTVMDLTERKRTERVVEQARVYAESIVDTVREPLVILTHDLRLNSANRGFYETFRTTPEQMVGRPLAEIEGGSWNIPELLAALGAIVPGHGEVKNFEVAHTFPSLGPRVMLLNARKLLRIGNDTAMILLAIEDITVRKTAETRLHELNASLRTRSAELEAVNRELEAFSYSVSHDLRAPLRHIDYFSSSLQKALPAEQLNAKAQRYLNTISESARNMGQLIDDLLSFARLSRTELRRSRVRLGEIVNETRVGLSSETNGRNISWEVAALPEVDADPALLRQVFVNLLSNAVKYTRRRAEARIEIASQPGTNGEVVVFVRDNGAGFDMKYVDKLFGVFQRLHASHEFEGTGVGLANVRRIVERHGGRIWAEAELERGATFYFTLPTATS